MVPAGAVPVATIPMMLKAVTTVMTMRPAVIALLVLLLLLLLLVHGIIVSCRGSLLTRHEDARAEVGAGALDCGEQHLQLILLERLEELLAPQHAAGMIVVLPLLLVLLVVILAHVAAAAAALV